MMRIILMCACMIVACKQEPTTPLVGADDAETAPLPPGAFEPKVFAEQYAGFQRYWYKGKAELTRYALKQARYGDLHDGEAVMIFVTEDFLPDKQVKLERGENPNAVSVLKLNAYRRFFTGIYPYSVMTSTFTPAEVPGAKILKASTTVQEWCGHVYTQVNRRGGRLKAMLHSYFEGEADQKIELAAAPFEDGLWTKIRRDPGAIETGTQQLIPALHYLRMDHKAIRAYPAVVKRESGVTTELTSGALDVVRVTYSALSRELEIFYEPEFPRTIVAWKETVGPNTTTAVRTRSMMTDYWNRNGAGDGAFRQALGVN